MYKRQVVDTTNIGAIFRSAAALGIDAVLLTRNSCDPLNRRGGYALVSGSAVPAVSHLYFHRHPVGAEGSVPSVT